MRPNTEDRLQGATRLLRQTLADHPLPPEAVAELRAVLRLLDGIEAGWAARLPFLVADNEALCRELAAHAGIVGGSRISEICSAAVPFEPAALEERNSELRGLLSAVLSGLPADEAGDATRARIVTYLRDRVERDPG